MGFEAKIGVYIAKLVSLGYHKIPWIDHGDYFILVTIKTTFTIIIMLMMKGNLNADIVHLKDSFYCKKLELEIFIK